MGLEVTEESVRAVEISLGRTPQLIAAGEVPLPPDAAKDSEVLDVEAVAVALRQLWSSARINPKGVVLGVASRRILVREYTTQSMRPDLLKQALPFQVQDLLPVPVNQAVLDFYPVSEQGDQVSGLLVAAVAESIEHIIKTLGKVKVRVNAVDLTAFGLAKVSTALASPDDAVGIVYIGDHTTQVVVTRGGVPQFVRLLPVDVPTAAVQRRANESVEDHVLPDHALETVPPSGTRSRGSLRAPATSPSVSDLAARLRSTLSFYANRSNSSPVANVLVTGAGASVPGMVAALTAAVDTPLRVIDVNDVVKMKSPLPAGDLALNLVSTVGIALGGSV